VKRKRSEGWRIAHEYVDRASDVCNKEDQTGRAAWRGYPGREHARVGVNFSREIALLY
jgi:hypothetical protein